AHERIAEKVGETYRCLVFSPDGRTLALGGDDGTIRLWDMPRARERVLLRGHKDVVWSVAFSRDGRRLVSSGKDGRVLLWHSVRGAGLRELGKARPNSVQSVAFAPGGQAVAFGETGWSPQDVTLWDPETGALRARLTGHHVGVNALAFSPDGRTLASG